MTTIIICSECDGTGQKQFDVGAHKSEYETRTCGICNGSGRMVQKIVTMLTPYVPGSSAKRIY